MAGRTPVRIRPAADADLDVAIAIAYLREKRPQSAGDLLDAFEQAIALLQEFPKTGSPRMGQWLNLPALRSLPLDGFPYLVFYVERDHHVEIVRLLHTSRDLPAILLNDPPPLDEL